MINLERKEVFRTVVGSSNYNLHTPESDTDWKVFVLPSFDDLYDRKEYAKSIIGETADYDIHDIRKLINLFYKSNINFLEVLYSNHIQNNVKYSDFMNHLKSMKQDIVVMNLPYLYNACVGMHYAKMNDLTKGTSGTQHLMEKYGYCTKNALHAYRVLDFLFRFMMTDFTDFKHAMTYDEMGRKRMLDIKNGVDQLDEFKDRMKLRLHFIESQCKQAYLSQKPNEKTKHRLEQLIRDLVRRSINEGN
jgi:predicted nucleotidyltransferase